MERPLFSEMLFERRRQLGLSIKQASNVLRLKEEVLVAFEEGDFESIPKSGYAQGMLSSYARYLGLNAKTVVNQFSQDLFEHERGAGSHEARRNRRRMSRDDDGPLYETPQANVGSNGSRRTYVESRGFLPTSGGFAGDMGDFATTSPARPRYRSQSSSSDSSDAYDYPQGRPYTSRVPLSGAMTPLGQVQRQRSRISRDGVGPQDAYSSGTRGYLGAYDTRDQVTTRRVSPSQYRDDMRLDNTGGTFETASSTMGRRSSRNIASTQRPNVNRRSRSSRDALNRRDRGQNSGGIMGMLSEFFSERGRVVALIIAILALLLTLTIILSVSSCIRAQRSTGRSVTVTSAETESEKTDEKDDLTDEEERIARERAAAEKAAETESPATERTIEVTVDEGGVTWLEVEYDGKSDIAETVTGPWDRTYTVRQSISISVNDTTAVTVTENGKKLEFDSKASGIVTITIQVSKSSDAAAAEDDKKDQATTDQTPQDTTSDQTQGQVQTPGDQTGQQQGMNDQQQSLDQNAQAQTGTGAATGGSPYEGYTLDSDGYYYGADGYYDANGNFYQY